MFLLRWLIFLLIGLPFQGIVMTTFYPIIFIYWRVKIYKETPVKAKPIHDFNLDPVAARKTTLNGALLDNDDDHGAFTMYGFIQKEGLELLQVEGNLIRRINDDGTLNRQNVSGDVVVAWFFANTLADRPASDEVVKNVADSYIKNLGTLSFDDVAQGYVSARCSNFGINEAKDSDFLKLSQPAAGPQYHTTAAVLASAYNKGFKYKALYWSHWLLMGGWYWTFAPIMYTEDQPLWYVRDITMKSLYIQLQTFGPRWWITRPMKVITDDLSTHENDLFSAMLGRETNALPQVMNPFFSQRGDASSSNNDMGDRNSIFLSEAIKKIQKETKYK